MRVLTVGAGVVGSAYAGRLFAAGHAVTLCARTDRLAELEESGRVLEDAHSRQRVCHAAGVRDGPTVRFVLIRRTLDCPAPDIVSLSQ